MKPSKQAIDLIKKFEGCSLTAYLCPAKKWTIGYGHTGLVDGKPIVAGMKITRKKAEELLMTDLSKKYALAVNKLGPLNQNQYDALISFCYNLGVHIFKGNLLKAIKQQQWVEVARQLKLYNKAKVDGVMKELTGLTRRRTAEAELFLKPIEEDTYVIKKVKMKINGTIKQVDAINIDGNNYVKLQDIKDANIKVDYDPALKIPVIEVKN